jgi:hypothetical protein
MQCGGGRFGARCVVVEGGRVPGGGGVAACCCRAAGGAARVGAGHCGQRANPRANPPPRTTCAPRGLADAQCGHPPFRSRPASFAPPPRATEALFWPPARGTGMATDAYSRQVGRRSWWWSPSRSARRCARSRPRAPYPPHPTAAGHDPGQDGLGVAVWRRRRRGRRRWRFELHAPQGPRRRGQSGARDARESPRTQEGGGRGGGVPACILRSRRRRAAQQGVRPHSPPPPTPSARPRRSRP